MERVAGPISVLNIDYVFIYHHLRLLSFFRPNYTTKERALFSLRVVWSDKKKTQDSFHGRDIAN